jgi:Predicted P-loop ATPase
MKETFNILLNKLAKRNNILIFVLIISFILFKDVIGDFFDQKIVDGILCKIKSHWLIDLAFLSLVIFILIITTQLVLINRKVTNGLFVTCLFLFALFFHYRISSEKYHYEPYFWFPSLKYVDFIYVLFASILLLKIWSSLSKNKAPIYKDSPFLIDKPINFGREDKFGRKDFARKIADKIQSKLEIEDAGALAIGINGQWGSGKTSFMNMIYESIDKENRIIIYFNSWRSSTASVIIEDFFELLIDELKPYDPELSSTIADYAKSLTKIDENLFTKTIGTISDLLSEEKNKNEVYDFINESIKKIKKQILIFIDDLDRLDKKEIIEVLRIIRNTANFNNVVYIVSYDKEYVKTAIKDFNEYNFEAFLEKIFQFEFTLPLYEHGVLKTEIKRILKEGLEEKFHKQIERVVDSREIHGVNFTNEIVKTYRDVIRLSNSLLFEIETIKEDVFFFDFYLLQLLKLKFPKVYESLIEFRYIFFTTENGGGKYSLKQAKDAFTDENELLMLNALQRNLHDSSKKDKESDISSIEAYLNEHSKKLNLADYDKKLIVNLITTLITLKETNIKDEDKDLYKSFIYAANFHKYFAFRLYEGDISSKEFEEYRIKNVGVYKSKISEWIEEGKYSALLDRLDKIKEFSSILEFENHIEVLFELGRHQFKENVYNPYLFNNGLILKILQYPIENHTVRIYSNVEDYRNFLNRIFKNAPKPPLYESQLIDQVITAGIDIGLTTEELSSINLEYFKEYCNTNEGITPEFWQLYQHAIRVTEGSSHIHELIPEVKELFVNYYKKNLKASELGGFIRQAMPGQELFFIETELLFKIFSTWEMFELYLNENSNIKSEIQQYDEFMRFYNLYKESNRKPIPFNFELLNPNRWQ